MDIHHCLELNPILPIVCQYVENGWSHKVKVPLNIHPFFHVRQELELSDGLLLRDGQLILPSALTCTVLRMAHVGHPGMVRMKCHLRQSYWWPLLDSQIEQLIKCCQGCQMSTKSQLADPIPKISITKLTKLITK